MMAGGAPSFRHTLWPCCFGFIRGLPGLVGRTVYQSLKKNIILLVGGIPTPLKNMSSSVGKDYSIESHRLWNIENVQNHQPVDEHIDI